MCGSSVVEPLTCLINESIRSGTVPACWKLAWVALVFKKKGSKNDKKNYRPVSLLPSGSNILEHVVRL
jgi:hypothetical protein